MRVVITGAGGFIGKKIAERLAGGARLKDRDGKDRSVSELVLFDVMPPAAPKGAKCTITSIGGDIGNPVTVGRVLGPAADSIFHLAAVVSAGAEEDFDLGMRVNLEGTRWILEGCRTLAAPPKVVFASSVAVYGGDMPPVITDATSLNPQTSYGSQKAMGEMMVNDWSRKGFVDGCSLRLPTVVVRPGKPNKAASTWASSIIREPLQGHQAVCPVDDSVSMWVGSPRAVVKSFLHAHDLPAAAFGPNRSVLLPGMTVSVRAMMDTLKKVGGPEVAARVAFRKDERIARIVAGWAYRVEPKRAAELGFAADESYEAIVRGFVEDDIERPKAA